MQRFGNIPGYVLILKFPVVHVVPLRVCPYYPEGGNTVLHGVFKFNSGPSHNRNLHLKGGMLKVSVDFENIITDLA